MLARSLAGAAARALQAAAAPSRAAAALSTSASTRAADVDASLTARLADPGLLPHTACWIDGTAVPAASGATFQVTDPSTGGPLATVAKASTADTDAAIAAAAAAFPAWRDKPAKARAAILRAWGDAIHDAAPDLAAIMSAECGKPLAEARNELASAAASAHWAAGEAVRVAGAVLPAADGSKRALTLQQPVGVVGAITPWNFPASMVTRKVAPALAAGCTAVLKPAESTPLTAFALAELARRAGLPPGALNVVAGDAPAIGDAVLASRTVRKIGFTGSTAVGRRLYAGCAPTVKRLSLELGGNAAVIVAADADVEAAATAIAASAFRNAGQTCISASRVLVAAPVADALAAALASRARRVRVGRGCEPGTTMGPLITQSAVERVAGHVDDALARGAVRLSGGGQGGDDDAGAAAVARLTSAPATARGHWAPPTVLARVPPDAAVFAEETFGPVLALTPFASIDEALALANASEHGLASYAFTRDLATAWRLAEGLEVGMVGVNDVAITADNLPFGGVKASGIGREGGKEGIAEFLETKTVVFGVGYKR